MRKIYVVHPFGGKEENFKAITEICQKLVNIGVMPISPIHSFSFMNDHVPEERQRALEFCKELIKTADEVWTFGNWKRSEGCRMELKEATLVLKCVKRVTSWKNDFPVFKETYNSNC